MSKANILENQSGMTILGVVVAAAVLGVLSLQLTSIYESLQSQGAKTAAHSEARNLVRYLNAALTQPGICNDAFRTAGGARVTWPAAGTPVQVNNIVFSGGAAAAAFIGKVYPAAPSRPIFTIKNMYLRAPNGSADEPPRPEGTMLAPSGTPYRTRTAKFGIVFDFVVGGQQMHELTMDLIVGINPAGQVMTCYNPAQAQMVNLTCGLPSGDPTVKLYPGLDCSGQPLGPFCTRFFPIIGFDGFGQPKCVCQTACASYYVGPTGSPGYKSPQKVPKGPANPGIQANGATPLYPLPPAYSGTDLIQAGANGGGY